MNRNPGRAKREGRDGFRSLGSFRGILVVLGLAAVAACRSPPKASPSPLVILVPSGPISFIPNVATEDFTLDVLGNVYEPLVDLDGSLRLVPGLAESWYTKEDGTWVFRLQRGVLWHDGHPLQAQEVADAIERARTDPRSELRPELSVIRGISAPDPGTVVIRSTDTFEALPLRLAGVLISRVGALGQNLGTGPYTFISSKGSGTRLAAFASYRKGPPEIPEVVFRVVPDARERVRMMDTGEAQLLIDAPAEAIPQLRDRLSIRALGGLRVFLLVFSCQEQPGNPLAKVKVRHAIAAAIDREKVVSRLGYAEVINGIASREELGGGAPAPRSGASGAGEATRLLKEAGYPEGFEVDLDTAAKYPGLPQLLPEVQRELAGVGIVVHPKIHSSEDFVDLVKTRKTRMYIMGWLSDVGDSRVSYEDLLHSPTAGFGVYNGGGYSSPDMDRLIETASRTPISEDLNQIFYELDRKLLEDMPLVPLFRQQDLYAFSRNLEFTPRLDHRLRVREMRWR